MDALARCMSRAGNENAKATFRWALKCGTRDDLDLGFTARRMVQAVWYRSWLAISPSSKFDLLCELLSSSTLDDLSISEYGDPADVLPHDHVTLHRDKFSKAELSSCANNLIAALGRGGNARERASRRLRWMLDTGLLNDSDRAKMAVVLWDPQYSDEHGLPKETTLYDFVQLSMPAPQLGMAVRAFRKKWIGATIPEADYEEVESTVAEVSAAWREDLHWHRSIALSPEEELWFWNLVNRWLGASPYRQRFTWGRDTERESRVIDGIAALVARREVPRRILGKLYSKLETLSKPRQWVMTPIFHGNEYRLIAAAAGLRSRRSRRAETLLRMGIWADDEKIQDSALHGLSWWIGEASAPATRLRRPSLRCIEDVGILLASQHEKGAIGAMRAAIALLKGQFDRDIRVIVPLAVEALQEWWPALEYDRADVGGTTWDQTVVGLRRSCVGLAYALHSGGHSAQEVVMRWLDVSKEDPMAEVRYAAEGLEGFGLS